jgi:hypothetical protein
MSTFASGMVFAPDVIGVVPTTETPYGELLDTQPVKMAAVVLSTPGVTVPKSAVPMLCVHDPALPQEIVGTTVAVMPCV